MNKHHFIGGEWVHGVGAVFSSYNPATMDIVWQGSIATASEVGKAVDAAEDAFALWMETTIEDRCLILKNYQKMLHHHQHRLAKCISMEVGKPLWEAMTEVSAMINKIDIAIEAYEVRTGVRSQALPNATLMIRHKPHGVVSVLGPYNFPGHLPNGHIVPAVLAGNTVVFKPSSHTPLVAEMMMECWQQAGLPSGVINMVQGDSHVGNVLVKNPKVKAVFFTGSYQTGALLHREFAGEPEKLLALEMGGNNPLVVYDIQDFEKAAYLTILSAFITSGQRCTCARRLIVSDNDQGQAFLSMLIDMSQKIRIGFYEEMPEPFMGPVISSAAGEALGAAQKKWLRQGGESLLEMKYLNQNKAFVSPGIIDVTHRSVMDDEEHFGPLLQVIRVHDIDEAIDKANQTAYGLVAGILTDKPAYYQHFYQKVHAGVVNWNTALTGASSRAPFGGVGKSGNHRPSAYYAADYCAYPVASTESQSLFLNPLPGLPELR